MTRIEPAPRTTTPLDDELQELARSALEGDYRESAQMAHAVAFYVAHAKSRPKARTEALAWSMASFLTQLSLTPEQEEARIAAAAWRDAAEAIRAMRAG